MIYSVDQKIFGQFPAFCRGVVVASDVKNTASTNPNLETLLKQRIEEIEMDASLTIEHPRIKAWSDAYNLFLSKASVRKMRPSIAALVSRIKSGKGSALPFISTLVCISNLISLTYLVPSGLVDAEKVAGDLRLGYAQGTERFTAIGSDRISSPEPGEVIYFDNFSNEVICRAWNSRGAGATAVMPSTTFAVIDVDGMLTVVSKAEIEAATTEIASLVARYCGAITSVHYLNGTNPTLNLSVVAARGLKSGGASLD